jgi:hypothetical protein
VVALAMRFQQNRLAPRNRAAQGVFWGQAGPRQRTDNEALARTTEPIDVWVSDNSIFTLYEPMGRYTVRATTVRWGRNRVKRFFNLLRVGDIEEPR